MQKTEQKLAGYNFPIYIFLSIGLVIIKFAYLNEKMGISVHCLYKVQPELWILACTFGLSSIINLWLVNKSLIASQVASLVLSVSLALLFTASSISYVTYLNLGILPRLEQIDGLTWGIVGPNIVTLIYSAKYTLILLFGVICVLIYLVIQVAQVSREKLHRKVFPINILFVLPLIITLAILAKPSKQLRLLGNQIFEQDLSLASSEHNRLKENVFFDKYYKTLSDNNGINDNYKTVFDHLKGKNIVFLILESVRAKDISFYGGNVDMPNFQELTESAIVFRNMYSQDTRSTKAYPALDMGMFSLTAWKSYSNNLPKQFEEISLAHLLNNQGIHTSALVNGDGLYDKHVLFSRKRGYKYVKYSKAINGERYISDDYSLLKLFEENILKKEQRFYSMLWPIATHHPYGYDFWKNSGQWIKDNPEGISWDGEENYPRYRQSLKDTDLFIGKLIDALKRNQQYHNTVLILVGDHGEAFGEHEKKNIVHGNNLYQESIHVPALIHNPSIGNQIVDERFLPIRDLSASIFHLINGKEGILNDARSIFLSHSQELPLYFFHTANQIKGIIYHGYKLRIDKENNMFFSSIGTIEKNSSNELNEITQPNSKSELLNTLLEEWYSAMSARTHRLLRHTTEEENHQ